MPVKIPNGLPAAKALMNENIFVMDEQRAYHQDIRPIKIAIINLMPTKHTTEIQLLRLLGSTPLQLEIDLIQMLSHTSKNTPSEHLISFYKSFGDIQCDYYDGLIITGAPVEIMPFEDVDYWDELAEIMEWSNHNVFSTFHICWGAQAGLYYHYGIDKYLLDEKLTGVFPHSSPCPSHPLMRGFDDVFYAPHSRYTSVRAEDIAMVKELQLLSVSDEAGVHIAANGNCRKIFVTGHSEYDRETLADEYARDRTRGEDAPFPSGYFPGNDPGQAPVVSWRAHANLLFSNWVNFVIYQHTPYDLSALTRHCLKLSV